MTASSMPAAPDDRGLSLAGWIIGFALGGFFDGILLHQVLQWHHLLSLVEGEALRDIRTQILADGMFHVLMYVIAAVGLWLLWRGRAGFSGSTADRRLLGSTLLGFSIWQFVDVGLFHWILGIHRIRVDVPNPLFWDVAWVVVFGVPTLAAALWLRRGGHSGPPDGTPRRAFAAVSLALTVIVAGPVAALPPAGTTTAMVLFRPGTSAAEAFAAVARIDGRIVWADPSGELLAIDVGPSGNTWHLYAHGALLVSNSAFAGCLAWARL